MSLILPKNEQKQVELRYHSTVGRNFLFVFWKNSGYQQVVLKLSDLYPHTSNFSQIRLSLVSSSLFEILFGLKNLRNEF